VNNCSMTFAESRVSPVRPVYKHRFFQLTLLLLISVLTGCQSGTLGVQPQGQLAEQNHWQMKARVSIRTEEENVAATLDWQKQGIEFDFHIYGTFGVTYAHLIQEPNQAVLKLPDDQIFYHQNAQRLLYQSLGWDFPIDALAYWVKGLPSYQSGEKVTRSPSGDLSQVQLNDWQVEFARYQNYAGYHMPRIIKATHPQMSLKVVVKDWEFLPANYIP